MQKKSEIQETSNDYYEKIAKKRSTMLGERNLDYISLFIILFGMILTIIGFWETETILWNRIKYTTGSLWQNSDPVYLVTPLSILITLLDRNILYYIIGNFLLIICIVIIVYQYIYKRFWFKTTKILLALFTMFSLLATLISFWLYNSLNIIEEFPSLGGTKSGYDWIRVDIAIQSNIIQIFSIIYLISFLIIIIPIGYIMVKNRNLIRKSDETLDDILSNSKNVILSNDIVDKKKPSNKFNNLSFGKFSKSIPFYIILIGYLLFTIFPVFLAVKASISSPYEINNALPPSNPIKSMIMNYSSVMFALSVDEPSFRNAFFNSLFIGFGTSLLGLALSVTSAYALARFKFRGKTFVTFIILATQMFPAIILLIPQYVIMSQLGLLERDVVLFGLLLVMATGSTAYVTWMMKGYFETIPRDIEEAAYIDGYGKFSTFLKIVLPLAKSGMVAVMVFTFLSAWQEFILARTFIGSSDPRATLPLLFYNYQNLNAPDTPTFFELLSPYSILVATPVVVFYLILQKQLVSGALAGGVK